jgi:glycerol-3-phosphate dehydrogenase
MTLVGVWHRYTRGHPDRIRVSPKELAQFVEEINSVYDGLALDVDDIAMINTGHILFGSEAAQGSTKEHSFAKRSLLIDHSAQGIDNLISVIGARATVARSTAEKTLNLAQRKLKDRVRKSNTHLERIHGGFVDDFASLVEEVATKLPEGSKHAASSLAHNYGSDYASVIACADRAELLRTIGDSSVLGAEIVHAVRHEMAKTFSDIVFRRTELGSGGDPGQAEIQEAAKIARTELNWTEDQYVAETNAVGRILESHGPWIIEDRNDQVGEQS